MGEDAAGPGRGFVGLAARLRTIADPPKDIDALVTCLEKRCGHQIEFDLFRFDPRLPELRKNALAHLSTVKSEVAALFAMSEPTDDVEAFTLILPELIDLDRVDAVERSGELFKALALIERTPMISDTSAWEGRPKASELVNELLLALAEYLREVEGEKFAVYIPTENRRKVFKSRAAYLAKSIVDALGLSIPDTELKTNLNKVRTFLEEQ